MNTKQCARCEQRKPLADFGKRKLTADGYSYYCRECARAYLKAHYQANKQAYVAKARKHDALMRPQLQLLVKIFRSGGCALCPETCECCLAAHHRDPSAKEFHVSEAALCGYSLKRMAAELQKCVCLCFNCHTKVHAGILQLPLEASR